MMFNRLVDDVRDRVGEIDVTLEVGKHSEFPEERNYAYCEISGDEIRIVIAPDFTDLCPIKQEAILRHELAHAIEFRLGLPRTNYEFGPMLSRTPERRADDVAQLLWGDPILYDENLIQTLDQGIYPRPAKLGL